MTPEPLKRPLIISGGAAEVCEGDACAVRAPAPAHEDALADNALLSIPFRDRDGGGHVLADHLGQVVLVVNVASKCGLTVQYEGLQALYRRYRDQGFTVLGFPSNDFMGQEPGSDTEIAEFCSVTYGVEFPVFAKISVVGAERHPLYAELVHRAPEAIGGADMRASLRTSGLEPSTESDVMWNFEKFLLARDGSVVARFAPDVTPDDPRLVAAVNEALTRAGAWQERR